MKAPRFGRSLDERGKILKDADGMDDVRLFVIEIGCGVAAIIFLTAVAGPLLLPGMLVPDVVVGAIGGGLILMGFWSYSVGAFVGPLESGGRRRPLPSGYSWLPPLQLGLFAAGLAGLLYVNVTDKAAPGNPGRVMVVSFMVALGFLFLLDAELRLAESKKKRRP